MGSGGLDPSPEPCGGSRGRILARRRDLLLARRALTLLALGLGFGLGLEVGAEAASRNRVRAGPWARASSGPAGRASGRPAPPEPAQGPARAHAGDDVSRSPRGPRSWPRIALAAFGSLGTTAATAALGTLFAFRAPATIAALFALGTFLALAALSSLAARGLLAAASPSSARLLAIGRLSPRPALRVRDARRAAASPSGAAPRWGCPWGAPASRRWSHPPECRRASRCASPTSGVDRGARPG